MRRARRAPIAAIALVLVAGVLIYSGRRSGSAAAIVGVVRATEVRVEPEVDGQLVSGNITVQARQAILNLLAVLAEAGYAPEQVVRCGVWLEDPRDFGMFNTVFREFFGEHPPARSCVVSSMAVDCKVEIDCVAYKDPA